MAAGELVTNQRVTSSIGGILPLQHRRTRRPSPGERTTPDFAVQMAVEMGQLLTQLQDKMLATVATMKMEGHTNVEVAAALSVSTRTVIRKLEVIRSIWSSET